MRLPISVLDLSPVGVGMQPSQAIRDSIELARAAERLGYTRYWFAEHHNMASIATSSPAVLIAAIAARTERIRVGAGGIMVPNHAPLQVVETFRTLEALYPGRIDLGLGRAPGTDPLTASALRRSDDPDVNHSLAELLAFERGDFPPRHPYHAIIPQPSDVRISSMWMLGSTLAGAAIAAQLGVPYAFAGHFAMRHARDAIALYRSKFQPSAAHPKPYAMLAVTTICGSDDEEAERLTAPIRVAVIKTRMGTPEPILPVEDALKYTFSPAEQVVLDDFLLGAVIGGPRVVGDKLLAIAHELEADELMLSSLVPRMDDRTAILERVAQVISR